MFVAKPPAPLPHRLYTGLHYVAKENFKNTDQQQQRFCCRQANEIIRDSFQPIVYLFVQSIKGLWIRMF